ncbi:MAG: hypothetical protein KDD38_09480 [Bdellovibrionales bacterium]|nr:hypothetical protein [Bdellovibrionales bacterium]
MANTEDHMQRLVRNERKLSLFMSQELLFEYEQGRLDADRKKAIEKELQANSDLKLELKAMRAAKDYTNHLSRTKISEAHIEELKKYRPLPELLLARIKWRNWPDLLRWSFEAFVVSVIVAVVATVLPWGKFQFKSSDSKTEVTLAEITNEVEEDPLPVMATGAEIAAGAKIESTTGEQAKLNSSEKLNAGKISAVAASSDAADRSGVADNSDAAHNSDGGEKISSAQKQNVAIQQKAAIETESTSLSGQKGVSAQGFLINILANSKITAKQAAEIREKIIRAGGVKAGQVELGWYKTRPDGHYYHFSMPEKNYEKLIAELSAYSTFQISKNPHTRIMPKGKVRVILFLEDDKSVSGSNQKSKEGLDQKSTEGLDQKSTERLDQNPTDSDGMPQTNEQD